MGPPTQDCVTSIEGALSTAKVYSVIAGLVFILTSLIGLVEAFIIGCRRRKNDDDF